MDTIHHLSEIGAPPDRVFEALNSEAGLSGWWTTVVSYPEPGTGSEIRFTFEDPFHPVMEVTALDPGVRVAWRGANEPWLDAEIRFELSPSDRKSGGTTLRFWQRYSNALADDAFGIFNYNWAYYLESLRLLLEEGEGRPFEA
ncbi:MAG TPA: SRPBCC domain-containing protein [Solirubrobacterales bacterium]|nr:SRPBCC domain-containing protein [Solirubrobacterales bacterium]